MFARLANDITNQLKKIVSSTQARRLKHLGTSGRLHQLEYLNIKYKPILSINIKISKKSRCTFQ